MFRRWGKASFYAKIVSDRSALVPTCNIEHTLVCVDAVVVPSNEWAAEFAIYASNFRRHTGIPR